MAFNECSTVSNCSGEYSWWSLDAPAVQSSCAVVYCSLAGSSSADSGPDTSTCLWLRSLRILSPTAESLRERNLLGNKRCRQSVRLWRVFSWSSMVSLISKRSSSSSWSDAMSSRAHILFVITACISIPAPEWAEYYFLLAFFRSLPCLTDLLPTRLSPLGLHPPHRRVPVRCENGWRTSNRSESGDIAQFSQQ